MESRSVKRTIPKNTDLSKFHAYVVQTDQPVGMTVEGAIQLGQKIDRVQDRSSGQRVRESPVRSIPAGPPS